VEFRQLGRTELKLSVLGFGASPLGDEFGRIDPSEGERAVHAALDAGINFFDTSPYYGRTLSETRLGNALRGKRHRAVVATKCGRYGKADFDFSADRVKRSVDESLTRLGTDYLDLLTAHDIEFVDREQIINDAIPAMRELQAAGKVRYTAFSGLPIRLLRDVAERADVDAVLSYCHYNLMIRDLETELAPVLQRKGLGLINAAPVHMGILTEAGPPAWHPAPEAAKRAGAEIVSLCRQAGRDPAQVAIRFCVEYPMAATTLVGMVTSDQVQQNVSALNSEIDPDLLAKIEQIVEPVRNLTWASGRPENSDV